MAFANVNPPCEIVTTLLVDNSAPRTDNVPPLPTATTTPPPVSTAPCIISTKAIAALTPSPMSCPRL
jgi:hypothetical protein